MHWLSNVLIVGLVVPSVSLGCATGADSRLDEDARNRISELERENSELKTKIDVLDARIALIMKDIVTSGCSWPPPIDALVLDVESDLKFVALNKGKKDGIEPGFVFNIYRGSTFKGLVKIQDVREETSTGLIVYEKNPIVEDDSAATVL